MKPSVNAILWPIAPPLAILLVTQGYMSLGGVIFAHGASMNFLFLALLWGFATAVWEVFAVPVAIWHLRGHPASRTRLNVLAVLAGSAYVVAAAAGWYFLPH